MGIGIGGKMENKVSHLGSVEPGEPGSVQHTGKSKDGKAARLASAGTSSSDGCASR